LPETPASGAEHVAHMITAAVQHAGIPHEASPFGVVTLSCGVACLQPETGQSPERLTKAADLALYRAKRSERNVAAIYTAEQDGEI
ncbi:MAG TPA: diguanylate cyclase, partial [Leptospiraceae bacterium]|nr:diguanylate cyclase [Leptospiraceae bacterium]